MNCYFRVTYPVSGDRSSSHVLREPVREPRDHVHVEPRGAEGILAARDPYLL